MSDPTYNQDPPTELVGAAPTPVDISDIDRRLTTPGEKPAIRDFDGQGFHAVYSRPGGRGEFLGIITWPEWAMALERRLKIERLDGFSMHGDGSAMRLVRDADSVRQERLRDQKARKVATRARLADEIAAIDQELGIS